MIGKNFEVNELGDKMGIRLTSSAELVFKDLEVPLENMLGKENQGFYQAMKFFEESKIVLPHKMYGFPYIDKDGAYGISNRDNYIIKNYEEDEYTRFYLCNKIECHKMLAEEYQMGYREDNG